MVAAISPGEGEYDETLSTLRYAKHCANYHFIGLRNAPVCAHRYANNAKRIVNKAMVNEDPNIVMIKKLKDEILKLKAILAEKGLSVDVRSPEPQLCVGIHIEPDRIPTMLMLTLLRPPGLHPSQAGAGSAAGGGCDSTMFTHDPNICVLICRSSRRRWWCSGQTLRRRKSWNVSDSSSRRVCKESSQRPTCRVGSPHMH